APAEHEFDLWLTLRDTAKGRQFLQLLGDLLAAAEAYLRTFFPCLTRSKCGAGRNRMGASTGVGGIERVRLSLTPPPSRIASRTRRRSAAGTTPATATRSTA